MFTGIYRARTDATLFSFLCTYFRPNPMPFSLPSTHVPQYAPFTILIRVHIARPYTALATVNSFDFPDKSFSPVLLFTKYSIFNNYCQLGY